MSTTPGFRTFAQRAAIATVLDAQMSIFRVTDAYERLAELRHGAYAACDAWRFSALPAKIEAAQRAYVEALAAYEPMRTADRDAYIQRWLDQVDEEFPPSV